MQMPREQNEIIAIYKNVSILPVTLSVLYKNACTSGPKGTPTFFLVGDRSFKKLSRKNTADFLLFKMATSFSRAIYVLRQIASFLHQSQACVTKFVFGLIVEEGLPGLAERKCLIYSLHNMKLNNLQGFDMVNLIEEGKKRKNMSAFVVIPPHFN